ncbi:MAG: DUF1549 and DUF1553 domain-containing protein [Gemmataceae bacterium]|nr:DUF1549 and DUF1553 domain-containing protein [Gemmataceae bacterium]MDW8241770.1 DUF1553 domain-containing protein [Thermogemmata sp.]
MIRPLSIVWGMPTVCALLLIILGLPIQAAQPSKEPSISPQTQKINELIAAKWKEAGIAKPAERANDWEFMRRVFIDLIGRIPTPEEIIDFERDSSPNKRVKLVQRLLYEEKYVPRGRDGKPVSSIAGLPVPIDYNNAYAENFAEIWTTWLLTRSNTHRIYREQLRLWLTQQFANSAQYPEGKPWNRIVYDLITAKGKSNENGAVIFIARHLGDPIVDENNRRTTDFSKEGRFDAVPITSRVTRLFLGIQSQCMQCHDHPHHKEYVQTDFWGVNAFFRQTNRSGTTNPMNLGMNTPPPIEVTDHPDWNVSGMVFYERRDGQKRATFPTMLRDIAQFENLEPPTKRLVPNSSMSETLRGKTRREILAQWVIEHDNFARAFVNRMWGHLFGRGLTQEPAVDNFHSDNPVVHPELLNYLAEEFKRYGYDPKKLLEWICTSDVYNLSHVANKAYADPKYDAYFTRMPLKAMSPEVLFESLAIATRAEARRGEQFRILKDRWLQRLTVNFGDDEGNEVNFNGTVVQALLMMNGQELNAEIGTARGGGGAQGVVAEVVRRHTAKGVASPRAIYDELFLMTVSRHPTSQEIARLEEVRLGKAVIDLSAPLAKPGSASPGAKKGVWAVVPGAAPNDVAFYQDVFWALLNSNEFMLNH